MFVFQRKWFNISLVVLLMLAPMRGVLALQSPPCDMDVRTAAFTVLVSDYLVPDSLASEPTKQSQQISLVLHDMSHSTSHDMSVISLSGPDESNQNCCCCDGAECGDNCDMGIGVSLILQRSSYLPPFVNMQNAVKIFSAIQAGEFSPPSRPPRSFS